VEKKIYVNYKKRGNIMAYPSISVIVPVYNTEIYLKRCIDSIINQTFKDIEIILVDDGSTDNCPAICDNYASQDSRIKVIHKVNEGQGLARNVGISQAKGKYIAFVDSDDYIAPDMYEKLYMAIEKAHADFCACGMLYVDENENVIDVNPNPLGDQIFSEKDQVINNILLNMIGTEPNSTKNSYISWSVWAELYSREIIEKNNIRFFSERKILSEDLIFNFDFLCCTQRAVTVTGEYYYYRRNPQSFSYSYKPDQFDRVKLLYDTMIRKLKQKNIYDAAHVRLERTFLASVRFCIMQEVKFVRNNGLKSTLKNIRLICNDKVVQTVLKYYPIVKTPIKQRIFSYCMKTHLIFMLYLLAKFYIHFK
jgi:glycosyltransferase involved in cell wall biosynthesis